MVHNVDEVKKDEKYWWLNILKQHYSFYYLF
jgi:hypothetical protein